MVICYHFFPNNIICNFGWTGVDLFFVLSGFLITGRILPYLGDKNILIKFYRNRLLRIVPLYFGFLAIFFTAWFVFSSKETLSSFTFYQQHWWQFFLFIQNWVFANNLIAEKTHLQHLWSVAVEEQIYLLFPLILIFFQNKIKILYAILFLIISLATYRWYYYNFLIPKEAYLKVYLNTFFRFDSFLTGVVVYFVYHNYTRFIKARAIQWLGFACFIVLFSYILLTKDAEKNNAFISSGGYTIIAIMYAGLLITTLLKKNKLIDSITLSRFLKYTGRISYGIYIFHWPLFLIGFAVLNKTLAYLNLYPENNTIHIINVLVCIPTTYLISHLSFKYYELYFLKRKLRSA